MFKLISKLYQVELLSPNGIFRVVTALLNQGINLMAILQFSSKLYPNQIAIDDGKVRISYEDMLEQSQILAHILSTSYGIKEGDKIAIICKNRIENVQAIFACSRLGVDLYLLNTEMSRSQLDKLISKHLFSLVIYEGGLEPIQNTNPDTKLVPIESLIISPQAKQKLKKHRSGSIVVLSGGTTGEYKTAKRKPALISYLNPFFAVLTTMDLNNYKSVFIATPIYHGFGLAALIISVLLGSTTYLQPKFDAKKLSNIIDKHKIAVVTLVPLMLQRFLDTDTNKLSSLKIIISGGAALNPRLIKESSQKLGDIIYNLYGTSEAGFCVLATPNDLKTRPTTIGKKLAGVSLKITGPDGKKLPSGEIGLISIRSSWSMNNKQSAWIKSGDLGYIDQAGYLFLRARVDDMIISGGVNVYPIVLESALYNHEDIIDVAVIGITDRDFGQRLKAFVVIKKDSDLNERKILNWLSDKVARYEKPSQIEILDSLPKTPLGKTNKKLLAKKQNSAILST